MAKSCRLHQIVVVPMQIDGHNNEFLDSASARLSSEAEYKGSFLFQRSNYLLIYI